MFVRKIVEVVWGMCCGHGRRVAFIGGVKVIDVMVEGNSR
jgi:hypothetical protein